MWNSFVTVQIFKLAQCTRTWSIFKYNFVRDVFHLFLHEEQPSANYPFPRGLKLLPNVQIICPIFELNFLKKKGNEIPSEKIYSHFNYAD